MVNTNLYVQKMEHLNTIIQEKRTSQPHGVIFLYNNTWPRIAKYGQRKQFQTPGSKVLPHKPYSPDLAAMEFHLFQFHLNAMRWVSVNTDAASSA